MWPFSKKITYTTTEERMTPSDIKRAIDIGEKVTVVGNGTVPGTVTAVVEKSYVKQRW